MGQSADQRERDDAEDGGNVLPRQQKPGAGHHPRPDVPGSHVEDQADQPGVSERG
jgi:hypothetical protein